MMQICQWQRQGGDEDHGDGDTSVACRRAADDQELGSVMENQDLRHVRSLTVITSSCVKHLPSLVRSETLRVLDFEGCKSLQEYDMNVIDKPFQLYYLGLRGTNMSKIPSGIVKLYNLEILDLGDNDIEELPSGIVELTKLRYLLVGEYQCRCTKKPDGIGASAVQILQKTNLSVITDFSTTNSSSGCWTTLAAIVESLCKLVLIPTGPGSSHMTHIIARGAFPKVQYMRVNSWPLFQPGAMPYLESVELSVHVCAFVNNANFDYLDFYRLRSLPLLKKVHVAIICWGAKTEDARYVERTLRHVVQHHPNHPTLVLERLGQCADDKQLEDSHSRGSGSTQRDVDDKQICHMLNYPRVAPEIMSLELLKKITKNFSKKRELGRGTFGTVYKGVHNGEEIAVKLLHHRTRHDYEEEFRKEFENLRRLKHPNIVQLLGYCYETKREFVAYEGRHIFADNIYRALCFEYMFYGSLQGHLHDEFYGLEWQTRYKIIKGICEGLKYLHEGLESPMYHLDLKPGNILLGNNMEPKLADFGLSKLVCDNQTRSTTSFVGTIKYCPPEYIEQKYVSNKFDIFSLGVIMIEIIAGSEGYCKTAEMLSEEFINHVQENWRKRMQATLGYNRNRSIIYECHQVKRCTEIALDCVLPDRKQRPSIGDIISWLNETENDGET